MAYILLVVLFLIKSQPYLHRLLLSIFYNRLKGTHNKRKQALATRLNVHNEDKSRLFYYP